MTIEAPSPTEIKEIRQSMKMTQEKFAVWLGLTQNTITCWETGRKKPAGTAKKLLVDKLREIRSRSRN